MEDKKIMICDDDPGILEVLQMTLEIEGYQVFTESNSTNLMKEMSQTNPDLLLMDLWMPVLSGDQLLKTIRTTQEFHSLPVIILSASVDGGEIAGNCGANSFIPKPFDLENVLTIIRETLRSTN